MFTCQEVSVSAIVHFVTSYKCRGCFVRPLYTIVCQVMSHISYLPSFFQALHCKRLLLAAAAALLQGCISTTSAQARKYTRSWSGSQLQQPAAALRQLSLPPKPKAARANPSRTRPAEAAALTRQQQQQQQQQQLLTPQQQAVTARHKQQAAAAHLHRHLLQQHSTLCPMLVLLV
jgi:hypothetical protein